MGPKNFDISYNLARLFLSDKTQNSATTHLIV